MLASKTAVVASVWLMGLSLGFSSLAVYDNQAALVRPAPSKQPPSTSLPSEGVDGNSLIMFVHPYCPCSRATINELSKLMTHCGKKLQATVVFFRPRGETAKVQQSDLWKTASSIPGISLVVDNDGAEQRRYGASTSGETLLYDGTGRLRFHGGITASRGHEGDNIGLDTIESLINASRAPDAEGKNDQLSSLKLTRVFGCSIKD